MAGSRRLEEARQWLQYAEEHPDASQLLLAAAPARIRQALFAAQQAAEKALKAFLISRGRAYPLTHNLLLLSDLCAELDASLAAITRPALPLTDFALRFRYPGSAWEEIAAGEASEWLAAARAVCRAVDERVNGC